MSTIVVDALFYRKCAKSHLCKIMWVLFLYQRTMSAREKVEEWMVHGARKRHSAAAMLEAHAWPHCDRRMQFLFSYINFPNFWHCSFPVDTFVLGKFTKKYRRSMATGSAPLATIETVTVTRPLKVNKHDEPNRIVFVFCSNYLFNLWEYVQLVRSACVRHI